MVGLPRGTEFILVEIFSPLLLLNSIFIDLEQRGKNLRQGHLDTHKSSHQLTDIVKYRKCVQNAELLVRVNPLW